MVAFAWSSVSLLVALAAPPTLPPDRTAAAEPAAEPSDPAVPAEPSEPALVDPTSEPTAEPQPTPEPVVTPTPASDDEVAPREEVDEDEKDADGPVSRFEAGQWGMQFTFGGLAPMSVGGVRDFGVNRLLFSEIGFRRVLSNQWVIPFSIGAGVFHHNADAGDSQNDVGIAASVGVQRYFRVWRRIAPHVGGRMRIDYSEPNGRSNWRFGFGIGPVLGIEYFVGDRVSLTMQGEALVGLYAFDGLLQVEAATRLDAGGQMGLVFYF
jgi:hypothetical protein